MPNNYKLLHYKGYGLQKYRTNKASVVLSLLSNIREACHATSCESHIETLVSSCMLIKNQNGEYLRDYLMPDIAKLEQELNQLEGKIVKAEAKLEQSEDETTRQQLQILKRKQNISKNQLLHMENQVSYLEKYAQRLDQATDETGEKR